VVFIMKLYIFIGKNELPALLKTQPSTRIGSTSVFIDGINIFCVFGGKDNIHVIDMKDLWCFNKTSAAWTQLEAFSSMEGRYGSSSFFDPLTNRYFVYGGVGPQGNQYEE
jgi:hypothetical protein